MRQKMEKSKIYMGLSINGSEFDEFDFKLTMPFTKRLLAEYQKVVETGQIKGTDFMKHLEETQPDLADAIKAAIIDELHWYCREWSDADGPDEFPLVHLDYYIERKPSETIPGASVMVATYIHNDNKYDYDFTDMEVEGYNDGRDLVIKRAGKRSIIIDVITPDGWENLFERGEEHEFIFDVNESNLDMFCPKWRDYIDVENPFETLKIEDASLVDTIFLAFGPEVEYRLGQDIYEVTECIFDLANKDQSGDKKLLSYEDFLCNVGTVIYKIKSKNLLRFSDDELDEIFK